MHELGLVMHVIRSVEEVAAENHIAEIRAVTLEIGEVSGVVHRYMTDCWAWAVKKTEVLQNAELIIESTPAITHCDNCGKEYSTVSHGKICPYCGSGNTWLLVGTEMNIKEILVPSQEVTTKVSSE